MKTKFLITFTALILWVGANRASAQGTAFTYQGRLSNSNNPVNGTYDLTFQLWNNSTGGTQIGSTLTDTGIIISNGLFTEILDFGAVYNGTVYYLALGVRTNGAATFINLLPRQELTPAPYAVTAENVDGQVSASQLTGTLPQSVLSGTYPDALTLNNTANTLDGNGSGLTSLNGSQITTGTISDARLEPDVALLDANQTFTGTNVFASGAGAGRLVVSNGFATVDKTAFIGLSLQFDSSFGEGAIMSSYSNSVADGEAFLSFYTKEASEPVRKQMIIDQYGGVAIDQQGANSGVINNETTNGAGLTFGPNSGEGIASQQTAGGNQFGLDFYTDSTNRMAITQLGQVGINTTNPAAQFHVVKGAGSGYLDNYNGGPGIVSDVATGDGVFSATADGDGWAFWGIASGGTGINVSATTGSAVFATATSGTAVYANSTSGSALTIASGAIHVTGAGKGTATAAFIHITAATNIVTLNGSRINNPLCNGDSNAVLFVTPNLTPTVAYNNHPVGVYYDGTGWQIINEDEAAMATNEAFNVLIIKN